MANQTNAGLSICADTAIMASSREIAISKLFTHNYSSRPVRPGDTVKIPVWGGSAAPEFNKTSNNYGTVNDTLGYAHIQVNKHRKHTFGIDEADLNDTVAGSIWDREGEAGGRAIGLALEGDIMGLFTYDKAKAQVALATSKANFAQLVATCAANGLSPRDCVVILTPTAYATLLGTLDSNVYGSLKGIQDGIIEKLYGFKAVIYSQVLPVADTASTNKAWGVIVPAGAVAVASAPIHASVDGGAIKDFGTSTDPESGLVLSSFQFVDPNTLETKANVVCHYGVGLTYDAQTCDQAPRFIQLKTA